MFSASVLDYTLNPRNAGRLEDATHHGVAGEPGEGPYDELWFKTEAGVILAASYETFGCSAAVACASLVAQLSTGRQVSWILSVDEKDLATLLGGLPEGRVFCSLLAIQAARNAFEGDTQ